MTCSVFTTCWLLSGAIAVFFIVIVDFVKFNDKPSLLLAEVVVLLQI